MRKLIIYFLFSIFISGCAVHQKSNIRANEEFVVELVKPRSRGGILNAAVKGLFFGVKYFADKSTKALTSNYSKSISINDYYNTDFDEVEKTYKEIHIKKYSKPISSDDKSRIKKMLVDEINSLSNTRGPSAAMQLKEVVRSEEDDFLNFKAVIELISHPENPGVTRLSFKYLNIYFSKTKVFSNENLNARLSISVEGQWRGKDGTPMKKMLIEQEYDFKNLKYGTRNQLGKPLLSPWYYDIPILSDLDGVSNYGIVNIKVQLQEYEGNKSKYINKLPTILTENKDAIIKDGPSAIQRIVKKKLSSK